MRCRILQVVHGMARGGVETWLMHVARNVDLERFPMDFLTATPEPRPYDEEIRALGCRIHYCAPLTRPISYARNLARVLRDHGPYRVVHSHLAFFSAFCLNLAERSGVPIRIAHIHNTDSRHHGDRYGLILIRHAYRIVSRHVVLRTMTHGLANSVAAAGFLFGPRWSADGRIHVLPYGLDLRSFASPFPKEETHRSLGIPPGRRVIGHVGRFHPQKNHEYLVEILGRMVAHGSDVHLVLVGSGERRQAIEALLLRKGLLDRCTFVGERADVAPYYAAMDVFVFPSRHEGLGIVAVEAQAAGTCVLASTEVPSEAEVVPALFERMPLAAGPERWARRIEAILARPVFDRRAAYDLVAKSRYSLATSLGALTSIYAERDGD